MTRGASAVQNAIHLFEAGQHAQAKDTLRRHLMRAPQDAQANKHLAMFHGALHEDDQAFIFITRAAMAAPNDPEIQFMLGNVATIVKKYKEGARAYSQVIRLAPESIDAYDGLAKCLFSLGDHAGAMDAYERAIAKAPDNPSIYYQMGVSLAILGRVDEGIRVAQRGLARLPDEFSLHEFVAYNRNFQDGVDPVAHREDHARLGRLLEATPRRAQRSFSNPRDPERPLRVAFLSGDFVLHACAFFLEGPLRALDRSRVVPYLYSSRETLDAYSERFKAVGHWRNLAGMGDDEVADLAIADGIDVLIECGGWTDRVNMFRCVPRLAPVQCTYLGYPNTTGLPTIDYRFVDALTDPPGSESHCTETLVRLPGCFLCYRPFDGAPAPESTAPPCLANPGAPITFGSFNRVTKLGPRTLRAWAEILRRVPESRLILKIQIAAEEVTGNFTSQLRELGIAPDRIISAPFIEKTGDHFPMYRRMDISLDSFPYNGTTTTCEAMYMGVPVVTLAGNTHRSRVGVSLLSCVGVPELIAGSEEEYVDLAVSLAHDRARIAEYHETLRSRMLASPLLDAPRFARGFEEAIRGVWRTWCAGGARA